MGTSYTYEIDATVASAVITSFALTDATYHPSCGSITIAGLAARCASALRSGDLAKANAFAGSIGLEVVTDDRSDYVAIRGQTREYPIARRYVRRVA